MNNPIYDTDTVLKAEIANGNEIAFKTLFDCYHQSLYQYILKLVKSTEVAEELVMDVFLKLWLARTSVPEIENIDGFLFKVAYNRTIDFFRSAARNEKFVEMMYEQLEAAYSTSQNAYNVLLSKEYEQQLRTAIDLLPERRREIYELSRDGQLSHDEIAQKLNISKSTVANSIVAAKEFIKKSLKNSIDFHALITFVIYLHTK